VSAPTSSALHEQPLPLSSPVYQGVLLLVVIELTVMVSLMVSYFYLRMGHALWPPVDAGMPELAWPAVRQGLLTLSAVPIFLAVRRRRQGASRALGWAIPLGLLLVGGYLGLLVQEYSQLDYDWTTHAYGSINWTMTFYQVLHVVVIIGFGATLWVLERRGGLQGQRAAAIEGLALYWYFLVGSSWLGFVTTHLSPYGAM
jgi:heme/copper-type cytochrome/quinol oxidase subunit 3